MSTDSKTTKQNQPAVENEDFYFENGLLVMTAKYLLKRGYCCGNGCRHCPYDVQSKKVSSSSRS